MVPSSFFSYSSELADAQTANIGIHSAWQKTDNRPLWRRMSSTRQHSGSCKPLVRTFPVITHKHWPRNYTSCCNWTCSDDWLLKMVCEYFTSDSVWLLVFSTVLTLYDTAMCKCYRERLQMLLDIFTAVNTHCFAAAAKAVVSYMDHLKTLKGLDTIVESSCPSSM